MEKGRKGLTSSPSTTSWLRSMQCKDGSGGEDFKETEKEEHFFRLWNKFLANKVTNPQLILSDSLFDISPVDR